MYSLEPVCLPQLASWERKLPWMTDALETNCPAVILHPSLHRIPKQTLILAEPSSSYWYMQIKNATILTVPLHLPIKCTLVCRIYTFHFINMFIKATDILIILEIILIYDYKILITFTLTKIISRCESILLLFYFQFMIHCS